MSESKKPTTHVMDFCREHCHPEVIDRLEHMVNKEEYGAVVDVLHKLQAEFHDSFLAVLKELNGCRFNKSSLASLMNEIRQYAREEYRVDIIQYVREYGDENIDETYGTILVQWIEVYQLWCRAIT